MKVEIIKQKGYNFLWIDDYLWMWDIPIECEIQKKIATESFGNVLVVGYGLGIVQKYLMENNKVNSVITVEKYADVPKICIEEYGKIYGTINVLDFYSYTSRIKYDTIIGDIWEDIIPEQLSQYVKFKIHATKLLKPNGKLLAWGKDYFEYLLKERKTK